MALRRNQKHNAADFQHMPNHRGSLHTSARRGLHAQPEGCTLPQVPRFAAEQQEVPHEHTAAAYPHQGYRVPRVANQQQQHNRRVVPPVMPNQPSATCQMPNQQASRRPIPPQGAMASSASNAYYARQAYQNQTQSQGFISAVPNRYSRNSGNYGSGGYGSNGYGPNGAQDTFNKKKMSRGKKIALGVIIALLVVLLGAGIGAALYINSIGNSLGIENEQQMSDLQDALAPVVENEAFYMLVLGSDARGDETSRSDVIMLARIDQNTGGVHLISIPRDTMVTIEGYGTQKINAAYAYGGPALAVQTVSEFAGVPISHYAEVHFDELEGLVDMLGGVTVNVPEGFSAGNGGVSLSAGEQVLNGEQALGFARERYNVSGGDFGRAQAQRLVAEAIIKEILATPAAQLPGVVSEAAGCVSTDMNLTDIIDLALTFQGQSLSLYSAACPSYTRNVDGVSYVCTMFDEWKTMMQLVDAGLDPADTTQTIPAEQQNNESLGAAINSPAPRDYHEAAAHALTTDDVAQVE